MTIEQIMVLAHSIIGIILVVAYCIYYSTDYIKDVVNPIKKVPSISGKIVYAILNFTSIIIIIELWPLLVINWIVGNVKTK